MLPTLPVLNYLYAGTDVCTSYNTVTFFNFSFYKCLEYTFPCFTHVISESVIGYTCTESVSEYSKFVRLLFQ